MTQTNDEIKKKIEGWEDNFEVQMTAFIIEAIN